MSAAEWRKWDVDGIDEHAMPCERCGELVRIGSSNVDATVKAWADGIVRVWCTDCGFPPVEEPIP